MKETLTFAQLSDPHLSSLQGVRWRDLANKRVLGYLSWRRRRRAEHSGEVLEALQRDLAQTRPEHLVITGDLTHIGLPDEFRQARRWLETLGGPHEVTVVPGNHDAYIHAPWKHSFSHWQPYMASDGEDDPDPAHLFPSLRVRGPVAFIGLSSARPSGPFFATGSLGPDQLGKLAQLLDETGRRGLFRVVLIHHPPVPGEEKWRKRLKDAQALCDVIGEHGAELVLHGHRHRASESGIEIPGQKVPVFGIPSASSLGHKPGRMAQYYLYRLQPAGDQWKLDISVRGYSPRRHAFAQVHDRLVEIPRQKPGTLTNT